MFSCHHVILIPKQTKYSGTRKLPDISVSLCQSQRALKATSQQSRECWLLAEQDLTDAAQTLQYQLPGQCGVCRHCSEFALLFSSLNTHELILWASESCRDSLTLAEQSLCRGPLSLNLSLNFCGTNVFSVGISPNYLIVPWLPAIRFD